ncbi:MAG: radical SAM family heme chaperone HemW [Actinobacteria bacterium]|nr:radical SAM family heme chaperone HemW [Actinomycetota bacterium]
MGTPSQFGVYVHIPFCAERCDYCAFATWTDRSQLATAYVDACVADVTRRYREGELTSATSVFFGGGTPSLLDPGLLLRILDAIPLAPGAEVTVECNPDSVDSAKLRSYRAGGVNRVSLGVQSMDPAVLATLGRTHDPAGVERAIGWIGEIGFDSWNVDLIYGSAGESLPSWSATVERVLAFAPPHVSAYALSVEPGTRLAERVTRGSAAPPDDDDQALKYERADDLLTAAGLAWYEISNWARPGFECRHNRCYWEGGEYLGIGCAAHGYTGGRRWWTVHSPERYIAALAHGGSPEAGDERLDAAQARAEATMLAIRTKQGAMLDPGREAAAAQLVDVGLVSRERDHVVLTRQGRLLASEVTVRLAPDLLAPRTRDGG